MFSLIFFIIFLLVYIKPNLINIWKK
jgi:hypothetical protein